MTFQNIIVAVVVLLAVLYVARRLWVGIAGRGGCGCGKSSCSAKPTARRPQTDGIELPLLSDPKTPQG